MSERTEGPWEAFTQDSFAGWWAVRQLDGAELGSCDGGFEEADARLMTSAPELLEALEAVLHENAQDDFGIRFLNPALEACVKAAIMKAKGE